MNRGNARLSAARHLQRKQLEICITFEARGFPKNAKCSRIPVVYNRLRNRFYRIDRKDRCKFSVDNFDSKNNEPSIDEDRTVWRLKVNENIENLRARDYLLIRINKRIKNSKR